jgi:hypothetical protein
MGRSTPCRQPSDRTNGFLSGRINTIKGGGRLGGASRPGLQPHCYRRLPVSRAREPIGLGLLRKECGTLWAMMCDCLDAGEWSLRYPLTVITLCEVSNQPGAVHPSRAPNGPDRWGLRDHRPSRSPGPTPDRLHHRGDGSRDRARKTHRLRAILKGSDHRDEESSRDQKPCRDGSSSGIRL